MMIALNSLIGLIVKLSLAIVLGGVIGIERKLSKKAAGFRTMILICMGSTLFAEIGLVLSQNPDIYGKVDVSRMLGHVIAGIGFLGAGTIMKNYVGDKRQVEGLTTAAAIWLVAAVGLLIGLGIYVEAVIATLFASFILFVFGRYEIGIIGSMRSIKKKVQKKNK